MKVTSQAGVTITLDEFWQWLKLHRDCIVRAGTPGCHLYDQEDLHWHMGEDAERNLVVELVRGKQLVAEIAIDVRQVLVVQTTPDGDPAEPERTLFELVGGGEDEVVGHVLVTHPFEQAGTHSGLKH